VGDSITGSTDYPPDLARRLGPNYSIGNFGVAGTTASLDSGSAYKEQNAFQNALQFQPKIVIIMLGTNDANPILYPNPNKTSFIEGYTQVVSEFQALSTKPKIYLAKPPPVFKGETGIDPQYFRNIVLAGIEKVATQTNLPIIDVYSALANHSELFIDGVHPDSEGAQLIANEIFEAINLRS
jgi:lysophospholipase L1-like esterase